MTNEQIEFISARSKSWHIFEGNYKDLCASCEELTNPTEEYRHNDISWIMHEDAYIKMLGIERKFHNFLASAKTLVDHTRVLMNKYSGTALYIDFEARKKEIGSSEIVKLCHDLRNYFLHQKNPADHYFTHHTWYEAENIIVARGFVRMSKKSLNEYSNWSKESRKIINLLEQPLDIRELVDEYFNEVSEFNRWLDSEFLSYLGKI